MARHTNPSRSKAFWNWVKHLRFSSFNNQLAAWFLYAPLHRIISSAVLPRLYVSVLMRAGACVIGWRMLIHRTRSHFRLKMPKPILFLAKVWVSCHADLVLDPMIMFWLCTRKQVKSQSLTFFPEKASRPTAARPSSWFSFLQPTVAEISQLLHAGGMWRITGRWCSAPNSKIMRLVASPCSATKCGRGCFTKNCRVSKIEPLPGVARYRNLQSLLFGKRN